MTSANASKTRVVVDFAVHLSIELKNIRDTTTDTRQVNIGKETQTVNDMQIATATVKMAQVKMYSR